MKAKTTRRALLMSTLSLLLCVSMLVGTTFAWFTDSVTSGRNTIQAGNLDVVLEYWDGDSYEEVTSTTKLFNDAALWEPGYTEVAYLKVSNAGSLALKYQLAVSVYNEILGKTKTGEDIKLSDHLQFKVVESETDNLVGKYATREAAQAANATATKLQTYNSKVKPLDPKDGANDEDYVALIIYMPTTVGNEANHDGVNVPSIEMGVDLFATQLAQESDSFDEYYDDIAAVFTVNDANALLAKNANVNLINCNEPNGILAVPANYTGTLVLNNVTIASVQEMAAVSTVDETTGEAIVNSGNGQIIILNNVVVKATEEGMSAITGTNLNITGEGTLTAVAKGDHAYGIGGPATQSIKISNITIAEAMGGHAYGVGSDTKYYKDAPEGGAAIGSAYNGAVITLNKVTVKKAVGGSKAAGIGARFHTGVTVNITDSTISGVEGGVSAAGIGGSRISGDGSENGTTINITNSTVSVKGGVYGAGIGSGYDTHCRAVQPLCTINITDSTISATGGQYAAGIGTGYHHAALAGEIKNSTVTAVSGEKVYKDTYTSAMDVGFGVVDPAREGKQFESKIVFNGKEIRIPGSFE